MTESVMEIDDKNVEQLIYLLWMVTRDDKCEEDVEKKRKKARRAVHNDVLVKTLTIGSECWAWEKKHGRRVNAVCGLLKNI